MVRRSWAHQRTEAATRPHRERCEVSVVPFERLALARWRKGPPKWSVRASTWANAPVPCEKGHWSHAAPYLRCLPHTLWQGDMACEGISQLQCCGSHAQQLLTAPRGDGPRAYAHDRPSPVHLNYAGEQRPLGPSRCSGQQAMVVAPPLTSHVPMCAAGGPSGRETRVSQAGMGHGGLLERSSTGPQVRLLSRSAASVP